MKILKNIPAENKKVSKQLESTGWIRLREPDVLWKSVAFSLPLGVLLIMLYMSFIFVIHEPMRNIDTTGTVAMTFSINAKSIGATILMLLFFMLHEGIHGLLVPGGFNSKKTFWGFRGFFAFVYTEEIITRLRYIIISLAPLILLSFVMPFLFHLTGQLSDYIIFLGLINAAGSCLDIFNLLLVSQQVPLGGRIVSNGSATFYRR